MNKPQTQSGFTRTLEASSVRSQSERGFTLVEMLVAVAVAIAFLSGMFLSRGNFDSTVRLNSIAREVALLVRQAQTYGSGGGGEGLQVGKPYGIYLDEGSPNEIILYSDNGDNPNKGYEDTGPYPDTKIETFQLPVPYTISEFCADNNNISDCASAAITPDDLSVYFVRPSLEANFFSQDDSGATSSLQAVIEITHQSSGVTERVIIDRTGYISTP